MNFRDLPKPVAVLLWITFLLPLAAGQQNSSDATQGSKSERPLRVVAQRPYRKWLNEDVVYIISDEERADFNDLVSDLDRDDFITKFWESRNPNPGSPDNKFKEEHYRRIAYANEHFAAGIPGWKTDRGRIYIMYGPPTYIDSHPTPSPASETWRYAYVKGIGRNVVFDFVDNCLCGEYALTKGEVDSLPRTFDGMNPQ